MALLSCGNLQNKTDELYFLVDSENRGILEKFSLNVLYYERNSLRATFFKNSELAEMEMKNFIVSLMSYDFDEVINLYQGDESAVLAKLITDGLPSKIRGRYFDYDNLFKIDDFFSKYLYAVPFNRDLNCFHTVEIYKKIMGVALSDNFDYSCCYKENKLFLGKFGLTPGYIIVQVSSAWKSKRYPPLLTARVVNELAKKGCKVVLTGTNAEKDAEREIFDNIDRGNLKNVISVVGKTTIGELVDLVYHSEGVVSPDTFAMHLGAIFNRRVIALFSSTNFLETGPYCSNAYILRSKNDMPLYGSFVHSCETHISDIKPEIVASLAMGESVDSKESDSYVFGTVIEKTGIRYLPFNGGELYLPDELHIAIHKTLSSFEQGFGSEFLIENKKLSGEGKNCFNLIDNLINLYDRLASELGENFDEKKIQELLVEISCCEGSLDSIESKKYRMLTRLYRISYNSTSQRDMKKFAGIVVFRLKELKMAIIFIDNLLS